MHGVSVRLSVVVLSGVCGGRGAGGGGGEGQ